MRKKLISLIQNLCTSMFYVFLYCATLISPIKLTDSNEFVHYTNPGNCEHFDEHQENRFNYNRSSKIMSMSP